MLLMAARSRTSDRPDGRPDAERPPCRIQGHVSHPVRRRRTMMVAGGGVVTPRPPLLGDRAPRSAEGSPGVEDGGIDLTAPDLVQRRGGSRRIRIAIASTAAPAGRGSWGSSGYDQAPVDLLGEVVGSGAADRWLGIEAAAQGLGTQRDRQRTATPAARGSPVRAPERIVTGRQRGEPADVVRRSIAILLRANDVAEICGPGPPSSKTGDRSARWPP